MTIDTYRLVNDAEECRYLGTFDDDSLDSSKCRLADALARFGVSKEVARKVVHAVGEDYVAIDWNLPICCKEHERFLTSLKEAATSGSPVRLGR